MNVYLASPSNQVTCAWLEDMPVLLSYAMWSPFIDQYHPSFGRILVDSGAYSVFNSGKTVDLSKYRDWCERWNGITDAIAGLDDISGDWRQSMKNYEAFAQGFPTYHESDPPELLDDLVAMAAERNQWLGIGLIPPRNGKERFVRETCDRIPDGIHVHGWALRGYTRVRRLDSVDSTNWLRDAMDIRKAFDWLTYSECVEIVIKRYKRWERRIVDVEQARTLFN